jgi:CRISPR-associated protein Csm1
MTRSGDDAVNMSDMAENALEKAKKREVGNETKNAVCCFNQVVSYTDYENLLEQEKTLEQLHQKYGISGSYIYGLLSLCEDADAVNKDFMRAMWRSKLVYRTQRMIETNRNIKDEDKQTVTNTIVQHIASAIEQYKTDYKIALFIWLYKHREN